MKGIDRLTLAGGQSLLIWTDWGLKKAWCVHLDSWRQPPHQLWRGQFPVALCDACWKIAEPDPAQG